MKKWIMRILSYPILALVFVYRHIITPFTPSSCRHYPTCSNYMMEAIKIWGPFKGFWLGVKRLSTCHPWGTSGIDPVPQKDGTKK